jgi:hypothetical protein
LLSSLGSKTGFGLALAAFLITAVCAGSRGSADAAATPLLCDTSVPAPPVLRAESVTELVANLTLTCSGGTPPASGQPVPTSNFTIFFNTEVTSRILPPRLVPKGLQAETVEAVLTAGGKTYKGVVNGNAITFYAIPTPGTTPPATDVYQFTGIRVDASGLGSGSSSQPASVVGSLSVSSATAVTISNPTVKLGTVQPGLTFSVRDAGDAAPLTSAPTVPCTGAPMRIATASFQELFEAALKTQADEDAPQSSGTGSAGADFGSRVELTFANVPKGVTLYVDRNAGSGQSSAELTASAGGGFSAVPTSPGAPGGLAAVPLVNGTGTAVWEVLGENPTAIEKLEFGVYASRDTSSGAGIAELTGGFAPTSTISTATGADGPIPRFKPPSAGPTQLSIGSCPTTTTAATTTVTTTSTTTTTTPTTTTTTATAGPDHAPPQLAVLAAAVQHILSQRALIVRVHSNERSTVVVSARAGSTASFAGRRSTLAAGRTASFALPLSRAALARVLRSLSRHTPLTARITIRARNAAGKLATATRTVELVR